MQRYESPEIINVGSGIDHTIKEMATNIKKIVNYSGNIVFDESKPDGTPRKLLNVDKITKLGWKSAIDLEEGLTSTYNNFEKNYFYYTNKTFNTSSAIVHV
jgi:GDP-L-fucose synthase